MARLGGDEFMLLLLGTNGAEAAAKVAQKVLEALRPPLPVDGHELTTSASIGIALFPHDGDDADTLIKNADTALSRAKEQGRNHYQFYTDDMNATAFERLMLESRLRKALEQGEFVLYYQPQGQPRRRGRWSASRRCCAGSTPSSAWCRRPSSSRWPRRPA